MTNKQQVSKRLQYVDYLVCWFNVNLNLQKFTDTDAV